MRQLAPRLEVGEHYTQLLDALSNPVAAIVRSEDQIDKLTELIAAACDRVRNQKHEVLRDNDFSLGPSANAIDAEGLGRSVCFYVVDDRNHFVDLS